jgi:alkylhydroperoxidase family enzyme
MPRIPPLRPGEIDRQARELLGLLHPQDSDHAVAGLIHGADPNIAATFVRHRELFRAWAPMVLAVTGGVLPFRARELILLRSAVAARGTYVWATHASLAPKSGLTVDEITRLGKPDIDEDWPDEDRTLLTAVDQLHSRGGIDDDVWARLAGRYDERALLEIPMLAGFSRMTAYCTNALDVQPDDWMEPVAPAPWQ